MSQPQETTGNVPGNDPLLDLRKPNAKRALEKIRRTSSFGSSEADGVNSTDLGELTEAKQVDVMHDAVGSDTPGSDAEGYGDWSDVQMYASNPFFFFFLQLLRAPHNRRVLSPPISVKGYFSTSLLLHPPSVLPLPYIGHGP